MMEGLYWAEAIMFDMAEITQNNILQVRDRFTHRQGGNTLTRFERHTVSSDDDLSDEPELVQDLAKLFPFLGNPAHPDGIHKDIALIRIMANDVAQFRYDELVHVVENGESIASERKLPVIVKKGDGLSGLPEKVQKVATFLFS